MIVSKSNFDLTDPDVLLRITLGLFQIPHAVIKITDFPRTLDSFDKTGFHPAVFWLGLATAIEFACAIGLVLGVYTKWAALLSTAFMLVVVGAILKTKGFVWLWNFGGIEFAVLWLVASAVVALRAWQQERAGARQPMTHPVGAP